jgi:hypothetical protein
MDDLIQDRIPHAPQMGLFVRPDIPETRLMNAIQDYAQHVRPGEVVALYDATLSGNGKDGAVFTTDRFVFQNTDLEAPQTVRYRDLIEVGSKRRFLGLGGKKVELTVNRGRATFDLMMDFSGQPDAADYVSEFLNAAVSQGVQLGSSGSAGEEDTDIAVVRDTLTSLRERGVLSGDDMDRMMDAITRSDAPEGE